MFGGTGTVAVVSVKNNRNFIHLDISKEYNETARKRLGDVREGMEL
jgi:DNA modification methylase